MSGSNPEKALLSDEENQRIFETEIKPELFSGKVGVEKPTVVILGGQPGSGKSSLIKATKKEFPNSVVEIIGDDLRAFHPKVDELTSQNDKTSALYTGIDAGKWVEKAIEEAKKLRVNVLLEGTMRNSDVVAKTALGFREAGYTVEVKALAVHFEVSELGILIRYEGQVLENGYGRMTVEKSHQASFEGQPKTIERIEREQLADKISIYNRDSRELYSNELKDGSWSREPIGKRVIETERNRLFTRIEIRNMQAGYNTVYELQKNRNAPENETAIVKQRLALWTEKVRHLDKPRQKDKGPDR